ncbi:MULTISPECIES: hypothetical protein [unclassified Rhizobium]|uniref:hypothetical protein n=1 Tax=unclassified Rhizobium TaxID=2613769 RepID=UPI00178170FC|nr:MULTISPECIES: hypothetical protein [unclassified Rhizobium]MBD8687378.1 hypothetical protein [Rhizobium sp. CFBP 13644]MBD8691832.1 hypothetical protein [Rhizobium sp. CFBP 13717]
MKIETPVGYRIGSGGGVTQASSKSTTITLNKLSGQIITTADALAANTAVGFGWNNSEVKVGDVIAINHVAGGTTGNYHVSARVTGAGAAAVHIRNLPGGACQKP